MSLKAQSDVGIELWKSTTGAAASYSKLISIKTVPATGSAPQKLDTTELDSPTNQYIAGRKDIPDLEFDYNYIASNYAAIKAIEDDENYFMIVYGDGSGVEIFGTASTWIDAVSANQPITAKLHIVPQSIGDLLAAEVTALKTA